MTEYESEVEGEHQDKVASTLTTAIKSFARAYNNNESRMKKASQKSAAMVTKLRDAYQDYKETFSNLKDDRLLFTGKNTPVHNNVIMWLLDNTFDI